MLIPSSINFLEKPKVVYDSREENLHGTIIPFQAAEQDFMRDAGALTEKPFSKLRFQMNEEDFGDFLANNGYAVHKSLTDSFFDRYKGSTELPLYFDLLPLMISTDAASTDAAYKLLVVVAFGEMQPQRWVMVLEGLWKVREE
jgi:hypothetical protein